jgi:ribosomal protein L7/L12
LGLYPKKGQGTHEDVARLRKSGHDPLAVVLYRELTGADLKEARDAVAKLPS